MRDTLAVIIAIPPPTRQPGNPPPFNHPIPPRQAGNPPPFKPPLPLPAVILGPCPGIQSCPIRQAGNPPPLIPKNTQHLPAVIPPQQAGIQSCCFRLRLDSRGNHENDTVRKCATHSPSSSPSPPQPVSRETRPHLSRPSLSPPSFSWPPRESSPVPTRQPENPPHPNPPLPAVILVASTGIQSCPNPSAGKPMLISVSRSREKPPP